MLRLDVSTAQHSTATQQAAAKLQEKKTQSGHRDSFLYPFRVKAAPLETGFSSQAQLLL